MTLHRLFRRFAMLPTILAFTLISSPAANADEVTRVTYEEIQSWPAQQRIGDRITIYLNRFETSNIAGIGAGAATAALTKAGVPGWVAPILGGIAREAAYHSGQCATLQFTSYSVGCHLLVPGCAIANNTKGRKVLTTSALQ